MKIRLYIIDSKIENKMKETRQPIIRSQKSIIQNWSVKESFEYKEFNSNRIFLRSDV